MYTSLRDDSHALLVAVWSGTSNTDADYDAVIADLGASTLAGAKLSQPAVQLMFAHPENPTPTATQRQRLVNAVRESTGGKQFFAMVTPSILMRGVVTAVAWFAPPTHKASAHATLEEALAWVEEQRPGTSAGLRDMAARLRREVAQREASARSRAVG